MASIIKFFLEVKAELTKVVWPSREETIRYTIAVILITVFIGALLGAADYGLFQILQKVVNR